MALLYDLDANEEAKALLTAKVTALTPQKQAAEQQTAEAMLRLRSPIYSLASDVERIVLAIVHQMNFQVAQGVDPEFTASSSSTKGGQTNVFRDRYISPRAAAIVEEVALQYAVQERFTDTFTSFRTRSGTG